VCATSSSPVQEGTGSIWLHIRRCHVESRRACGDSARVYFALHVQGFKIVTDFIDTKNNTKLLWIVGLITFFMSAVLDNLTSTIVMISLLRKLIKVCARKEEKPAATLGSPPSLSPLSCHTSRVARHFLNLPS
jgi:hypothetical protein